MTYETAPIQAYVFIMCIVTGITCGLLYDLFRGLRLSLRLGRKTVFFLDMLFWTMSGGIVISVLYMICGMQMRWYVAAGVILGTMFYLWGISRFFLPIYIFLVQQALKLFLILAAMLSRPVVVVCVYWGKKVMFIVKFIKKLIWILLSFTKKTLAKCKRIGIIIRKV